MTGKANDNGVSGKLLMRSRHLRAIRHAQVGEPLPLPPVPQKSRGRIRFLRQCSPQRTTPTFRRQQHQNLCILRGGVARILHTLWLDIVLVTVSMGIRRLGVDSAGHARYALHSCKAKTRSSRLRSPLVQLPASETAKLHNMSRLSLICSREATALIKGASFSRIRKKTHDLKPESGTFNKRLYQRLPDVLPPCRSCDVHPSQSGHIIVSIGIN